MGAEEQPKVEESERADSDGKVGDVKEGKKTEEEEGKVRYLEAGEVREKEIGVRNEDDHQHHYQYMASLNRLNPTNPLRIVINGGGRGSRLTTPPTSNYSQPRPQPQPQPRPQPQPQPHPPTRPSQLQTRSTPTAQQPLISLNSGKYTNKISLFLFVLHMAVAIALVSFLVFKGVQGLLRADEGVKRKEKRVLIYFLPQVEGASLLSITLAFAWQKAFRVWPNFMVHFILWSTFLFSLSAGIFLICLQKPPTDGVGVCLMAFAIGNALYACWVNRRIKFSCKILVKSLEPVPKFSDLNHPTYWMLGLGFMWMSVWILGVIGALNFYFPPLIIIALFLSLAWTMEVMRNVVNITVSRAISLYYLRGMQSNTKFCFQRAVTRNLGSACLGSLLVPSIEALRIVARGLNLLEGEDEFMFSCAHCCLRVMETIFNHGNGWAFVQIAAYGKGFVQASQDTWALFKQREMETIVDSDITSSICFLTGVCSGSICVILVAAWTLKVHQPFTATVSLLAFLVGYLMTRVAMALPHACVSCYYVCYSENPENRFFDKTIKERQDLIRAGRDVAMPTPRVPRRFAAT